MVPNLKAKYTADVAPALMKKFQYKSTMQIPTIDKIVINVGCGKEANGNSKVIESVVRDIAAITGQKPIVTHARKSVVKACRSVLRLPCAVTACGSSSIVCST